MIRLLKSLARDRRGVAAIELAFVAPAIATLAFVSFEAWQYSNRVQDMKDAVKTGVVYYMNGGKDDADAETIAEASWHAKPADGNISISRGCICGTTAHSCTTLCSNTTVPEMRVTLSATATYAQSYFAPNLSTSQVVRVR